MTRIGRRSLIAGSLMSAALTAARIPARADTLLDRVKIGVLSDFSGPFAAGAGKGSLLAAQMAAEDFAPEADGLKVEIVFADHLNRPDVGTGIVRRWVEVDDVAAVVDVPNSAVAMAVSAFLQTKNRMALASASATSDLTGKACQPTTVRWALDTWALGHAIAQAILALGGTSWFFLSVDYALGKALERDTVAAVESGGGKLVGSVSHPLATADFSSFLLQAQSANAQVLALADTGADAINAVKQIREFQILGPNQFLAGLLADVHIIDGIGLDLAQGMIVSEPFYWDLNDRTRSWAARFSARHDTSRRRRKRRSIPPRLLICAR